MKLWRQRPEEKQWQQVARDYFLSMANFEQKAILSLGDVVAIPSGCHYYFQLDNYVLSVEEPKL